MGMYASPDSWWTNGHRVRLVTLANVLDIMEAENSGISKHIPHLGDTVHPDGDDDTPTSPFNLEWIDKS